MSVRARVDQLRIHPHLPARSLDAALEKVSHAELFSDFPQIAREAGLVLHHTRPADHFQVGDLRKVSEDLVLYAISKISVLFITAEIFEGKHRDTFFGNS